MNVQRWVLNLNIQVISTLATSNRQKMGRLIFLSFHSPLLIFLSRQRYAVFPNFYALVCLLHSVVTILSLLFSFHHNSLPRPLLSTLHQFLFLPSPPTVFSWCGVLGRAPTEIELCVFVHKSWQATVCFE